MNLAPEMGIAKNRNSRTGVFTRANRKNPLTESEIL